MLQLTLSSCDSYVLPVLSAGNNYYTGTGATGVMLNAGDSVTTTQTIYIFAETGTTPNCSDESNFTITIVASPVFPNPLHHLEYCDPDADGFGEFDLQSTATQISGGNPNITVTFYETRQMQKIM